MKGELRVALYTPLPKLANEMAEVLRLFYSPLLLAVGEQPEGYEPLMHTLDEHAGIWRCQITFRGYTWERELPIPAPQDTAERTELVRKRLQKRLSKLTLYDLCRELTALRPPWGALTGIRPTRLLYALESEGFSLEDGARELSRVFDVSPEKSELLRRIVTEQKTLPAPGELETDLYISIPFCRTRCAYCSFPGEAVGKGKQIAPYLDALLRELAHARRLMEQTGRHIRAVYVGGGTPTALPEDGLRLLLDKMLALFPDAVEYTVEAGRPDTLTAGKLRAIKEHGVTRISINPQTMVDETLRAIGRDHTAAQTVEAFRMARELGFGNINMDVIAGLPGETPREFARTMEGVRLLSPESLTVHTLAIKRSSRLNLEKFPLPDGEMAAEMVQMGEETASALGMRPYYLYRQKYMAGQQQNVGYARPGCACLYNVDIMEETTSIIAVGAGAISKRVFPDRELRIERAPNVSNVPVYLEREHEMEARKEALFTE